MISVIHRDYLWVFMSFDLFFCWPKPESIDFAAAENWAMGFASFTKKQAQLWYENPKTGVYFSLEFQPNGTESPTICL